MVEICTNVRLLPYNTADNFGRCLRNSLPNSCVRTTRNTRNFNPNPNGKLFESDYWHASCPLYCKLADAHLYISRPWSSGDHIFWWPPIWPLLTWVTTILFLADFCYNFFQYLPVQTANFLTQVVVKVDFDLKWSDNKPPKYRAAVIKRYGKEDTKPV